MKQLVMAALAATGLCAQTAVFTHATIIDGTGRTPLSDASMVVTNGRITEIGPANRVHAPAGAQVVDLSGQCIIPGLINLHGHLGENTAARARTYASYGITSVVSLGVTGTAGMKGDSEEMASVRSAQRAGDLRGARVYTSGRRFEFDKDPAEARALVDKLADQHVDVIKIVIDDRRGTAMKLPREVALAVIDQAHKHHLRVFAHIHDYDDAKFLVDNGVEMLAHEIRDREVDDALISAMRRHNVVITPTLSRELSVIMWIEPPVWSSDPFFVNGTTPERLKRIAELKQSQARDPELALNRKDVDLANRNLKKMAAAGVRIGMGSDSGNGPPRYEGFFEHLEMELMAKQGGMTPMQVIVAATKTNAEALGVEANFGTLAKGKTADFDVLRKNPLDDVANTRTLTAVYIGGKKFESVSAQR